MTYDKSRPAIDVRLPTGHPTTTIIHIPGALAAGGNARGQGSNLSNMAELLEDTLVRAEQVRTELNEILDQLRGELEAVKSATVEAHGAIQDLRATIREAKEEMRQSGKAEARKHLARQMRAAADILARDS